MCWMTIRREHDAAAEAVCAVAEHERTNGHSWGYAWIENGEIVIRKGVGDTPDDLEVPVTDVALGHTRLATTGLVNVSNAHPFPIHRDGEVVAALGHNGTWYGAPNHETHSDTFMMARLFEMLIEDHEDFEAAMQELVERCGETITVLHRSGDAYVYSGRFPITRTGKVAASSGLDQSIPDGEILKFDSAGFTVPIREATQTRFEQFRISDEG